MKQRRPLFGTSSYDTWRRSVMTSLDDQAMDAVNASVKRLPKKERRDAAQSALVVARACNYVTHITSKHGCFTVPVCELGEAMFKAHLKVLTFIPETSASRRRAQQFWAAPPKQYPVYTVHNDELSVPAPYGYLLWGCATVVQTTTGLPLPPCEASVTLRDTQWYPQKRAKEAVITHWRKYAPLGSSACTLVMPCGSGKTYTAIATAVAMGRRIAVLVHQERLLLQMKDSIRCMFPTLRVGVVHTKQRWEVGDEFDIVVFMIPTLMALLRRSDNDQAARDAIRADTFGTLIGDEAHHMAADGFQRVIRMFNARYNLWLTATPERDDGLVGELEFLTGPIVFKAKARPGALNVCLIQYKVKRDVIRTGTELNFAAMQTESAVDDTRNNWLAGLVSQLLDDGRTVLFNTARASLQVIPIVHKVYEMRKSRTDWRHKMPNGEYGPLIAAVVSSAGEHRAEFSALNKLDGVTAVLSGSKSKKSMVAKESLRYARVIVAFITQFCDGFDAPWIDAAVFAGSFGSEVATIQGANRISRVMEGKKVPWLFDVADSLPDQGFGGHKVFMNIQRSRSKIFRDQNFPAIRTTVSAESTKGICQRNFVQEILTHTLTATSTRREKGNKKRKRKVTKAGKSSRQETKRLKLVLDEESDAEAQVNAKATKERAMPPGMEWMM